MVLFDFDSMVRKEKIQTQPNGWTFSVSDGYAAPELVRGKCSKICEATDVYAIGAIAFYKLFGRTPNAMEPLFTTRPEMERSGMGFAFMEAFMDEVHVESTPGHGTTVSMRKEIGWNKPLH